jgi:tetratricopeptide (TPR) repeat protein
MKKNLKNFVLIFTAVVSGAVFISCSKPGDASVEKAVDAYRIGKYESALELFNKAMEQETSYSNAMIYTFISNTYSAQEDFENAVIWLEKALEEKPDYRSFVTLGMNYQTLKNYKKAEESYSKAIEMNPQKGEGWASLGMMFLEEGSNTDEALRCLKKGAEFSPRIAVIHAYLGAAYLKAGDKEKAEEEFAEAEKLHCQNLDQIKEKFAE